MNISPCPNPECDPADYTDEDDFGVFEITLPITGFFGWKVECDCGYEGPRADTAAEAIRLHNLISAAPDDAKQAGLPSEAMRTIFYAAFNWNDHNCKVDDLLDACRRIAKSVGVKSFNEANEWLTQAPDDGKGQPVVLTDAQIKHMVD